MTKRMLLLVSTAVLLVIAAVAIPAPRDAEPGLNIIFDMVKKYNQSIAKEFFVEDVSHLAEGINKCQDKFFCKVLEILRKHLDPKKDEGALVKALRENYKKNVTCPEVLKNVTPTGISRPLPDLMNTLIKCIQFRNLNKTTPNP
uniref:Uncharacterized protein n=1 Tax=Mola mola TaxID=94237 RepID=A0A3Q3WKL9_MOLML